MTSSNNNTGCGIHAVIWIAATVIALMCGGSIFAGLICWGLALVVSIGISYKRNGDRKYEQETAERRKAATELYVNDLIGENNSLNFCLSKKVQDDHNTFTIAVDNEHKKWMLILGEQRKYFYYDFSDLIKYEVIQDGESIISGTTGGALLGGMLFGVTGAVVGSSGERKISASNCTNLVINIYINDINNSLYRLPIILTPISKDSVEYRDKVRLVEEIVSVLLYMKENSQK